MYGKISYRPKSRKSPGSDFKHRWRNVDNNSADVTSEGRSFHVRAATTTGKTRFATVDSLTGGTICYL